jgi:hypothetical protein
MAKPWHQALKLRADLLKGELSQKEFAADLHDVIMGENRGVYHDPNDFFALTYPTTRLRELAKEVALRLSGQSDRAVRQLSLTYGGGKTHALITLVHLFADPAALPDLPAVREFKAHLNLDPPKARIGAVVFDRLDSVKGQNVRSPSGEIARFKYPWTVLAWQLAGPEGLDILGAPDAERETPPYTNVLDELLAVPRRDGSAVLILLDEVLMWARTKVGEDREWLPRLRDFFQCLTQAVARTDGCCLVASLLASDPAKNDALGQDIERELSDVFQRVADDRIQPVEKQDVAEVLRRRLFAPESYADRTSWKPQVLAALNGICDLDEQTRRQRSVEDERYLAAYPFHPDLTDVLFEKWTQIEGFQRTRGVLRTFAMALRDASGWGDASLLVGPATLLAAPDDENLAPAARELAAIARLESFTGRQQDWIAILQGELKKARDIQRESHALGYREIEQAVIAAFLHSQPPGQRAQAQTRELFVLIGQTAPDRIELGKGLARWADMSWYLDDSYTGDRDGLVPRVWRLGSKPNLRQMHYDAATYVSDSAVEAVLLEEIGKAGKLTEGAQRNGVAVHRLPSHPSEIPDDGLFHYAVLGPRAASEPGRPPSPEACRFLKETTTPDRERSFPNALVLAVPSREGLDGARSKIRDWLGWNEVQRLLSSQELDLGRQAQLNTNLSASQTDMRSTVLLAYAVVVTLGKDGNPTAFALPHDREPLFDRILKDPKSRIDTNPINARALLPGGPFGLWQPGDPFRYVKDLAGAFAANPALPKMLSRKAIVDTLINGCLAGLFVLRVTRPDRSQVGWWREQPDEVALADPGLEVVLCEAAIVTRLDHVLLDPGKLDGLWNSDVLTIADLRTYFSGQTTVEVDRGIGPEPQAIPAVTSEALESAVGKAVKAGRLWYLNGPISLQGEDIPPGVLADAGELRDRYPPPIPGAFLPSELPDAYNGDDTDALMLHAALSSKVGLPLPWLPVRDGIAGAIRLGLLQHVAGAWPCELGEAGQVKVKVGQEPDRDNREIEEKEKAEYQAKPARAGTATLRPNDIVELADKMPELAQMAQGWDLEFVVEVRGIGGGQDQEVAAEEPNRVLEKIKEDWRVG